MGIGHAFRGIRAFEILKLLYATKYEPEFFLNNIFPLYLYKFLINCCSHVCYNYITVKTIDITCLVSSPVMLKSRAPKPFALKT